MKTYLSILSIFLLVIGVEAQQYRTALVSTLMIEGTSTIHDWECDVETFSATTNYDGKAFTNTSFKAKVRSIKSGKSSMDKNIYTAMDDSKNPDITFKSSSLTVSNGIAKGTGNLTINGKTRQIPVSLKVSGSTQLSVSGSIDIKMTDYGIEPPVAVFGTIKTGNEITLLIDFKLNKF